ncbi:MAG: PhoH family protein [Eubacterium sp.]|nr:PhoH family protein [Candidatus Colimonas fimequi]
MISVSIDETIDRTELFGGMDKNIKAVEDEYGVDIIQRDNQLLIKGERPEEAAAVIREMMSVLKKGDKLDEQKINYIEDLSKEGKSFEKENVGRDIICFTHDGKPLKAKTVGQKGYVETIRRKDVVFGIGPAGTGKTYIAVAMAVNALKNKEVSRIILARPAVEAGERLGFLPGDLQEKVDPYLRPLYDALHDVLGRETAARLKEKETIEVVPLAYMRGPTLDNSFIILDEAQNTTPEQMKMFLTRMGFGSKVVVTGDVTQVDLPRGKKSGLVEAQKVLKGVKEIGFCYLKDVDVVRHQLVKKIIGAYDEYYRFNPPTED